MTCGTQIQYVPKQSNGNNNVDVERSTPLETVDELRHSQDEQDDRETSVAVDDVAVQVAYLVDCNQGRHPD